MAEEYEDLELEPRGLGFVLTHTDSKGSKQKMTLSEMNVVFLARLVPPIARQITASKSPATGVNALVAAPAVDFQLGKDLHNPLLLLRLRDEYGGEFDFSFAPNGARKLGERLIVWADKVASEPKPIKQ